MTQLIETYPADTLPKTGGCSATVVVTMTLDQLLDDLDAAGMYTLDTGGRVSAGEARRVACTAGVIPLVLGGKSQVLDVGRADAGCTASRCAWPWACATAAAPLKAAKAPGLCHAHHDTPWSRGGRTSVEDGRLLCSHHHRRIHDPHYETRHLPGGNVSFHRRT